VNRLHLRDKLPWALGIGAFIAWGVWYGQRNACGPFPAWESSPYVLPYHVGSTYYLNQSNCTNGGHQGAYKYSYDFVMPIGTTVTAARAGVVAEIRMIFRDGQPGEGESNWVKIRHVDGTIAAYSHLTQNGALVKTGDHVDTGQRIGLSGNTGNTGGLPHLHFHVSACSEPVNCGTLPVTFRNAGPNAGDLAAKRYYLALPYGDDTPPKDH
jgi:murein DD-endopeptidase MepM/ murein hydrolase activator NlpD